MEDDDYSPFHDALQAALDKVAEYYEKTSTTHAYTFSMRKFIAVYVYTLSTALTIRFTYSPRSRYKNGSF